jgi:hypothetical protein
MTSAILYLQSNGAVAIVIPTGELPVNDVAQKDVPAGVPYLIVDIANIPEDHTFFNAWEADFSNPDGHGIGADAYFAAQEPNQ